MCNPMKRIVISGIIFLVALTAGCGRQQPQAEGPTRTIRDMDGNEVAIPMPENIHRVAVIHTPVAQVAYITGVQDKLCAVTRQVKMWPFISRFDPGLKKVRTPVSGWEVNVEELLATRPDICIGSDKQLSKIAKITSIPLLDIGNSRSGSDFDYQKKLVRFFGDVFGRKERAEDFCRFLDRSGEMISARVDSIEKENRPRVLVASEQDRSGTYGKGSYMQEWLERAGCRNAAETLQPLGSPNMYTTVSPEQMLAWDPDIILVTSGTLEDLEKDAAWAKFRAVRSKRIYRIPVGVFVWNRPTAEGSALFPLWMAATAYPELFADLSPESFIKKFWKEILKYDLTDDDVYDILHPDKRYL
jgi:iron complex transport system substrate-binding protein